MDGYDWLSRRHQVLDLGRYQAGPRCAMVLSDLGAEVIKVEAPGGDESRGLGSVYWSAYNRGKKSITLNLRSGQGISLLKSLVPKVDMLLQNFRLVSWIRWAWGMRHSNSSTWAYSH